MNIEDLLNSIELVDLVGSRMTLTKKTDNNYFACCPFHKEISSSFSVDQTKQFYYCFGCGAHGNAIDFLMRHDHLSFQEAIEFLAKEVSVPLKPEDKKYYMNIYEDKNQTSGMRGSVVHIDKLITEKEGTFLGGYIKTIEFTITDDELK